MTECRYASMRDMDISNGTGIGVSIFMQGCPFHCPGCFNKKTWDMDGGKPFGADEIDKVLDLLKPPHIKRLSILGGEPLLKRNYIQLAKLLYLAKEEAIDCGKEDFKVWLWTGRTIEDIENEIDSNEAHPLYLMLKNVDYLIDGRFEQDKKDLTLKWRGSSNQRIIKLLENKEVG